MEIHRLILSYMDYLASNLRQQCSKKGIDLQIYYFAARVTRKRDRVAEKEKWFNEKLEATCMSSVNNTLNIDTKKTINSLSQRRINTTL